MIGQEEGADRFSLFAALVAAAGMAGLAGAYFVPTTAADRLGAYLGVAGSVLSGAIALTLKRWALRRSIGSALGMLGAVFGVRLVLLAAGVAVAAAKGAGTVAFVIGFFGVYFVLQWVEISYVLAEQRKRGP